MVKLLRPRLSLVSLLLLLACLVSFSFVFHPLPNLREQRPFYSTLRIPPQTHPLPHPPYTRLFKQLQHPGSLGESIRVHTPFFIHSSSYATCPATHPNASLRCTPFNPALTPFPHDVCTSYLAKQDFQSTGLLYRDLLTYSNKSLDAIPSRCSPSTLLILILHHRDHNICHLLMRLLFGFDILQRQTLTPSYLSTPPIHQILILSPTTSLRTLLLYNQPPDNYHHLFVRNLFRRDTPVRLVVAPSFEKALPKISNSNRIVCFHSAVILHSHANRFGIPDEEYGPLMAYNERKSLPAPLSSDSLALRNHMFYPSDPPKMANKLLYVHRAGPYRKWTWRGEKRFRTLLKRVTAEFDTELKIFEGQEPWPTFWEQIMLYADASVIVGFHGAGLASCVFAPRGAMLIEIEPEDHRLDLFSNLKSSGLEYEVLVLEKGTSKGIKSGSNLSDGDRGRLEEVLRRALKRGVEKVAEGR